MMATTAVSDCPAIESLGRYAIADGRERTTDGDALRSSHGSATVWIGSVIDMQASLMQDQPARVVTVTAGYRAWQ